MSGNTTGVSFTLTTSGESHGPGLMAIVDGCPPGIELNEAMIQLELDRRRPGTSKFATQRQEPDQVRIISGVFEGKTTGTPVGMLIENQDQKSKDYSAIKDTFRPGHADFTYHYKYGHRDYRGGGRSSARETAMRVAGGAIAKQVLRTLFGVEIRGCMYQMGHLKASQWDWSFVATNPFFCPDPTLLPELEKLIYDIRKAGSSIGAGVLVQASGVPIGWGEPVFDRLDADIAKAMMGINAVKGVEIGDGFAVIEQRGEQHRDQITPQGFQSNHAGGVLGGISSGQTIDVRIALKPTSSLTIPGQSVDTAGQAQQVITKGRHDPCVGVRATPIAEAMLALTLVDHALRHRAQTGSMGHQF